MDWNVMARERMCATAPLQSPPMSACLLCPSHVRACAGMCVCAHHLLIGLLATHKATLTWKDFQLLEPDFLNPSRPVTGSSAMVSGY